MIPFEPFDKIIGAFMGSDCGDLSEEFFQVKQVHGDGVILLKNSKDVAKFSDQEGDAVICSQWGIPIAVRTADCVPILIAHPSRIIAVVHAGWRGTAAQILTKTLEKMDREYGVSLGEVEIAIGPAIGIECYEVGEDVTAVFRNKGASAFLRKNADGQYLLDLKAANAAQAMALGVPERAIELRKECTRCLPDLFYSHREALARGEAIAGRNYSWLMISP